MHIPHHQKKHPIIRGALLSLLALASLFSITSCGDEPEPLKIGVIAPLTGPAGHLADLVDGMKLAVGEVNTWAGKEGRKIELVIEDSKSSADAGGKAFERIEKRHRPHFYISATSRVSMALAPRAEERKVVLLGLATAAGRLTRDKNWVFKYIRRYNKDFNHYAANGYDAIRLMAGLLENEVLSRGNVKKVLESDFVYPGIFGEIKQQKGRREITLPLHSARIVDGRIVFLD